MKVYVVMRDYGFDDVQIEKAFLAEEKAKAHIEGKSQNWWIVELEAE
jgi:hypothetical protein